MAKKDDAKTVKARVLVAGTYGNVDDVVEVAADEAAASSDLDANPEAVSYAESLKNSAPDAS